MSILRPVGANRSRISKPSAPARLRVAIASTLAMTAVAALLPAGVASAETADEFVARLNK